jgi:hypothetical protein
MRTAIALSMTVFTGVLCAQTPVNKTYPVKQGQKISLHFDFPELVKISTWDKNEVSITGTVNINGGESDDAFELLESNSVSSLFIENKIRKLKELPHRITIVNKGEKITFKNKAGLSEVLRREWKELSICDQKAWIWISCLR